jgi:hypothetical protein
VTLEVESIDRMYLNVYQTRSYARLLRPGLSEVGSPELPQETALRRAFAQLERAIEHPEIGV